MSAPELKPCPFCGGSAQIEQIGNRRRSTIVTCQYCGCRLETGEECGHGSAWNRRADLPPTDAQVMAHPKVQALVEALEETNDALARQIGQRRHPAWVLIRRNRAALAAIQETKP